MKCTVVVGGIQNIDWKSKVIDYFIKEVIYELPENGAIRDCYSSQKSLSNDAKTQFSIVMSEEINNLPEINKQLQPEDKVLLIYAPPEYVLARAAQQNVELTTQKIKQIIKKWIADSKAIWNMYLSDPDKVNVCSLDVFELPNETFVRELFGTDADKIICHENAKDNSDQVDQHIALLSIQLARLKYIETARASSEVCNLLEDLEMVSLISHKNEAETTLKNQVSDVSNLCINSLDGLVNCVVTLQKKNAISEQNNIDLEKQHQKQKQQNETLKLELAEALNANCSLQTEYAKQNIDLKNVIQQKTEFGILNKQNLVKTEELQSECKLLSLQVSQLEEELESAENNRVFLSKLKVESEALLIENEQLRKEAYKLNNAIKEKNENNQQIELLSLQVNQLHEELEETYNQLMEVHEKANYRAGKVKELEQKLTLMGTNNGVLIKAESEYKTRTIELENHLSSCESQVIALTSTCRGYQEQIEALNTKASLSDENGNKSELLREIQLLQERLESAYLNRNVMSIPLLQSENYNSSKL